MVNMDRVTGLSGAGSPKLARALYTNTPEAKNELFFRKGDILNVVQFDYQGQGGWWLCTLLGESGICPGNYLELLEHDYQNQDEEAIPNYDVPKSYYPPSSDDLNPLDLYDVPKNQLPIYASASLVRSRKHGSDVLSLGSTGSSNRASSASSVSSSAQSSSSSERSFPVNLRQRALSYKNESSTYANDCIPNATLKSVAAKASNSASALQLALELDYDVPRSYAEASHPPHSPAMSGSRSCTTLVGSDCKESLDLYDRPRSVKNCVSAFESKYDHVRYRPPIGSSLAAQNRRDASKRSSVSSTASSSNSSTNPSASIDTHFDDILRNAENLQNAASISSSSKGSETYDVPPSSGKGSPRAWSVSTSSNLDKGYDMPRTVSICDSTETLSCHGHDPLASRRPLMRDMSRASLMSSSNMEPLTASLPAEVKMLPLCPKAAVTVCEKLRQEVITSINSILTFVNPKWRLKENLSEIMPELRFACVRLNLAVQDFAEFCSRTVSNSKKYKLDSLVIRLQKLLAPLSNGSQIIQKDVDELEAYLWSVDRLSVSAHENDASPGDALEQLVLCARSLQYDATEIANFIALNSTALFPEAESEKSSTVSVTVHPKTTVDEGQEDYDYVTLSSVPAEAPPASNSLNSRDQQLLEFYAAQIGSTTPLLSQSISTFISSVHQNDPPRVFNGHLKYVILLAYKMLFAGDTIHRNLANEEVKGQVEVKADDLHKAVVALHEASKVATRDFPKVLPMQRIIDHVWETTAAAAQLKKVIFNACF